mmetsp:Transcript_17467/g.33409  ORF Transcript_17467/g.33409 Transcript_17467/m.33409 type:complete len:206 (+) Transcript_17467:1471-2088(+)
MRKSRKAHFFLMSIFCHRTASNSLLKSTSLSIFQSPLALAHPFTTFWFLSAWSKSSSEVLKRSPAFLWDTFLERPDLTSWCINAVGGQYVSRAAYVTGGKTSHQNSDLLNGKSEIGAALRPAMIHSLSVWFLVLPAKGWSGHVGYSPFPLAVCPASTVLPPSVVTKNDNASIASNITCDLAFARAIPALGNARRNYAALSLSESE